MPATIKANIPRILDFISNILVSVRDKFILPTGSRPSFANPQHPLQMGLHSHGAGNLLKSNRGSGLFIRLAGSKPVSNSDNGIPSFGSYTGKAQRILCVRFGGIVSLTL